MTTTQTMQAAVLAPARAMRDAAAVPLIFITAWEGLVDRAGVHSGQKVLVHGGAGGVGHIAVQIARWRPSPKPIARLKATTQPARSLSNSTGRPHRPPS
jgi:NADPH:quinone reductase-like Zn-dependent oxidoreductase